MEEENTNISMAIACRKKNKPNNGKKRNPKIREDNLHYITPNQRREESEIECSEGEVILAELEMILLNHFTRGRRTWMGCLIRPAVMGGAWGVLPVAVPVCWSLTAGQGRRGRTAAGQVTNLH